MGMSMAAHAERVKLPSSTQFILNKGQWDSRIRYKMPLNFGSVLLEENQVTFTLYAQEKDTADPHHQINVNKGHVFKVAFVNSNPSPLVKGEAPYTYKQNYYLGKNRDHWATDVPVYAKARYKDLYQGIDLVYQESNSHLEYRYEVAAGANASLIKMQYTGVEAMEVQDGMLKYKTSVTDIAETRPFAYQVDNGKQLPVQCRFVLNGSTIGFDFPMGYNHALPLIIDPTLIFASYSGSLQNNFGFTATYDDSGNVYGGGTGVAEGSDQAHLFTGYPVTTGAFQTNYGGGDCDVTLSKFSADGTTLLYSTYLGGTGSEVPSSMIVNHQNDLIIYGITGSADFPVTANGYDTVFHGGFGVNLPNNGAYFPNGTDIYVAKLDSNGHMLVCTFMGGTGNDGLNINNVSYLGYNYADAFRGEVIVDSLDNVFIATSTSSPNLYRGLTHVLRDTLLGQQDGLLFRMSPNLNALNWLSYVGGSAVDALYSIDLDGLGNLYASGGTTSSDFATTTGSIQTTKPGDRDGILLKMPTSGTVTTATTYLGTSAYDQAYFVKVGPDHNVYVTGQTLGNYPVTAGKYHNNGGTQFLHCISPDLSSTVFSTVFGSGTNAVNISPTAFLIDECGRIYISGWGGVVNNQFHNGQAGTTLGLPVTADAVQSTTDGSDFYFIVFGIAAANLEYATFFGGPTNYEHVDGGTSRFDKKGIIYEAVCAGCLQPIKDFPVTPGVVSETDNNDCNMAVMKFKFDLSTVDVNVAADPSASGCVPLNVLFSSQGVNTVSYLWQFGDGTFSSQPNPMHTYTDTGTYHVTLIGANPNLCVGRVISDTSYTTVVVSDDSMSARFGSTFIGGCDSFVVQLNNLSLNATQYTWNFGDGATSSLPSPRHRYQQAGSYIVQLIASNPNSCNLSDTISTLVIFKPILQLVFAPFDTTACQNVPFLFGTQINGSGHSTAVWDFGDGSATAQGNPQLHRFTTPGVYQVVLTVTDTGTCNGMVADTFMVTVQADSLEAAFDLTVLKKVCDTLTVQLTNQSHNAASIAWTLGDGTTSTQNNITHSYHTAGTYLIQLIATSPTGCRLRDTATVPVTLKPHLTAAILGSDTSGCKPLVLPLNSQVTATPTAQYNWQIDGGGTYSNAADTSIVFNDAGTYTISLTVVDTNTCNANEGDTFKVTVFADTLHAAFDLTTLLNECDTLIIQVNDQSTGASSIAWDFGDGTTSSLANITHTYNQPDTFDIVEVVTGRYCQTLDTAVNQVILLPKVEALFTPKDGCTPYVFQPSNNSTNATSFRWILSDGTISTDTAPVISYDTAGQYSLRLVAYNPNTCNDSSTYSASINVHGSPTAFFETDSDSYQVFHDVQFNNQSTSPALYNWNFGDGTISTDTMPVHRYRNDGSIQPCLTVTDSNHCQAEYCKTLDITFVGVIDVPNAFSPNHDGANDILYVRGYGVEDMEFRIYNRWGELVFESHSLDVGWDGTYKGSPQEMEVYTYTLKARFESGVETNLRKGNITLIR